MRWVPFDIDEADLRNRIRNKMIRPTTIPQTLDELVIEQAISREALRLAFLHHMSLAVGLRGVQRQRSIGDAFEQTGSGDTYIDMMDLGMLVGSGGVLSHAPRRVQSALMMLDAFQPEGVTRLTVDSIFMMPQLGVLSEVHPQASMQVFDKDCLIRVAGSIAPSGHGKEGETCVTVKGTSSDGRAMDLTVKYGDMLRYPLDEGQTAEVEITPGRGFNVGQGVGKPLKTNIEGGVAGLIIDCRGRPLALSEKKEERVQKLIKWFAALDMYPMELLDSYRTAKKS